MKKNQKGFSVIEILLVLVVLSLIAFVAYYLGSQQSDKNSLEQKSNQTTNASEEPSTTTFKDEAGLYSFQLPKNWTTEYISEDKSFLTIKPEGFQAPGQENNWVMSVFVTRLPGSYADGTEFKNYDEFKKLTIEQSAATKKVNKEIKINGSPVWHYDETIKDHSATGPPEITGGYYDRSYIFHKDADKIIQVQMRVYQHESTNYLGDKITSAYDYSKFLTQYESISKSFKQN